MAHLIEPEQKMLNVERKLQTFIDENQSSPSEVRYILDSLLRTNENEAIKKKVESHQTLVGDCYVKTYKKPMFPEMKQYYKIISERGQSANQVFCLLFDERPTYWFDYNSSRIGHAGDYYLGYFDFEGIIVDEVFVSDISEMTPISSDEYEQAMYSYVKQLLDLKWHADHYRFGEVFPTEEKWLEVMK